MEFPIFMALLFHDVRIAYINKYIEMLFAFCHYIDNIWNRKFNVWISIHESNCVAYWHFDKFFCLKLFFIGYCSTCTLYVNVMCLLNCVHRIWKWNAMIYLVLWAVEGNREKEKCANFDWTALILKQ